jgi:hypothetical protein
MSMDYPSALLVWLNERDGIVLRCDNRRRLNGSTDFTGRNFTLHKRQSTLFGVELSRSTASITPLFVLWIVKFEHLK